MSDRRMTAKWASKLGFVLAAAGSAIGLGAIWKFPYVAGTSGEAHFPCVCPIYDTAGIPLLWGICIRPKSQSDAIGTYQK
ncbi:hypothetical protein PO124_25155 [Bacillus licheniformis]|nr:hypothetical protein [Bacillus licheniformis]